MVALRALSTDPRMRTNRNHATIASRAGECLGLTRRFQRSCALAFLLILLIFGGSTYSKAQSDGPYEHVRGILDNADNAQTILGFVHFGADYHGHTFLRVTNVHDQDGNDVPAERALIYRYNWEDDGVTDIAFFYDAGGNIVGSSVVNTNAQLNQPFILANLSIQIVGRTMINSDNKMSESDRKLALELIDKADAHGLLNLWLRLQ